MCRFSQRTLPNKIMIEPKSTSRTHPSAGRRRELQKSRVEFQHSGDDDVIAQFSNNLIRFQPIPVPGFLMPKISRVPSPASPTDQTGRPGCVSPDRPDSLRSLMRPANHARLALTKGEFRRGFSRTVGASSSWWRLTCRLLRNRIFQLLVMTNRFPSHWKWEHGNAVVCIAISF